MLERILPLLLFVLLSTGTYAQFSARADSLVFSGIVMDARTLRPLPDVNCSLAGCRGTVSDTAGGFRLVLGRGDTVRFTHVGYRPCRVVVPDTLHERGYMMGVFLSPDTLLLSDVLVVKRWRRKGDLDMAAARNNMKGVLRHAYQPVGQMDAHMNQHMMIEEYARGVEMKGHVDVGLGVGTGTLGAYRLMQLRKRLDRDRAGSLKPVEVDLLKNIYFLEKRQKVKN